MMPGTVVMDWVYKREQSIRVAFTPLDWVITFDLQNISYVQPFTKIEYIQSKGRTSSHFHPPYTCHSAYTSYSETHPSAKSSKNTPP